MSSAKLPLWADFWFLILDFFVSFQTDFTGPEKEVITKGVFSLEESLESLNSLHSLESLESRKGTDSPLFSTLLVLSRISRISKLSGISRKWTLLKRPIF